MKYISKLIKNSNSLWLLLFFISIKTHAQYNLVPNYSFENYIVCPNSSNYKPPSPWYSPTAINSQQGGYFNACSNYCLGVPYHCLGSINNGYQYPRTGNAYGLVATYSKLYIFLDKFYLQTKLIDSLRKGYRYYAEFYVNLTNVSKYGCNNTGMLFTNKAVYVDTLQDPHLFIPANPQVLGYSNPIITDTLNWIKLSGIFKAKGGEQFITIGNFNDNNHTQDSEVIHTTQAYYGSSYYVDDVSVIPLDSFCLKSDAGKDITIQQGDSAFIGSYTNGIDSLMWLENGTTPKDSTRPGFYVHPSSNSFYVLHQITNGCFSSDTVFVNVLLPLKFIRYNLISSLRGTKQSAENVWVTTNEINVSHFNIQRSTNGKDFTTIGKVAAQNKSNNEYSFIDELSSSTPPSGGWGAGVGVVYYRIQSIDFDGKKQYSTIQQINTKHQTPNIVLFPNPTKGYIFINLPTTEKSCWQITVTNMYGKKVAEKSLRANTSKTFINIAGATGVYFINVLNCTTGKLEVKKVILE